MALLDELLVRIGMDTSGVDEGADQVTSRLDGLAAPAAAAGLAAGALFAVGISSAMDIASAQTKLQNQLGLTETEAARAGGVAGDVFSAGFGGSLDEVSDSLGAVVTNIGGLGKATDAELQQMTKSALALADTFQFDVAESTQAVGTLIKAGLVKDGTEALDLLTATAQKLPDALREELPALTKEYGEFFDQLGFTGPDMMGLLAEAAKNPIFEIDKVGDALKELSLRLADTDAVKEPLKALKLDVKDIQDLVNEGKGTQAFDQIVTALKGVDDQTERTMLQAALFGGPGEDMGNTLLKLKAGGAAAANGLDSTAGAAKGVTDNMEASPAQQMDAAMRTLQMTLGEALLPILLKASEFFAEHKELIKTLAPIVLGLVAALGIMAAVIWLVNLAMLANPVAWIILGIVALIAVIALIILKWDLVKEKTLQAWDVIVSALGDAWGWITRKVSDVWNWVMDKIGGAWDWIIRKVAGAVASVMGRIQDLAAIPGKVGRWFGDVVNFVKGLPGKISRAASGMWNGITSSFRGAINSVIGWWNRLSFTIGGGSILGVGIPSLTLHTPNIPFLAEGGITTGPTLAMIGEGREDEAVLPLSKLEQMLNTPQGMQAPSVSKVQQQKLTVGFEPGAGDAFTDWLMETIRLKFGGDVARLGEEG